MKNLYKIEDELYIISDTENVNKNCWIITDERLVQVSYLLSNEVARGYKVILTTNKLLIKDGVQEIDDEFLRWFVKNPSCEYVNIQKEKHLICKHCDSLHSAYGDGINCDVCRKQSQPYLKTLSYKIIIPKEDLSYTTKMGVKIPDELVRATMIPKKYFGRKEEPKQETLPNEAIQKSMHLDAEMAYKSLPKQETLDEAAENYCKGMYKYNLDVYINIFKQGTKWQAEQDKNKYSKEDVLDIINDYANNHKNWDWKEATQWFEQFSKLKNGQSI